MDINAPIQPDDVAVHSAAGAALLLLLLHTVRRAEAAWAAFQGRERESHHLQGDDNEF